MAWGTHERVKELLGGAFSLAFEGRDSLLHAPSPDAVWDEYQQGFGPIKSLTDSLETSQKEAFREEFMAFHEQYRGDAGLTLPRTYLLSVGTRA